MDERTLMAGAGTSWTQQAAPRQPVYRYLLCDLLTDRLMAILPMSGVSFERRISRVGSLSGNLIAATPAQVETARLLHAYAGRAALWVLRDSRVWWAGIPWTVTAKQGNRGLVDCAVQAATFDSYAHHRVLRDDVTYEQVDQAQLIADLWDRIQADPRGNIGVATTVPASGVARDRSYMGQDLAYFGKLIEDLGDVEGGPEHTVDTYLDGNGERTKALRVANRLGSEVPTHVFTRAARAGGGRITDWQDVSDAVDGGTTFQTRGDAATGNAGEEQTALLSKVYEAEDLLAAGWPLLDVTEDRQGVSELGTLNSYAAGLRELASGNLVGRSYTVDVAGTDWTPNSLGDAVRLKLADAWHQPAVDRTVRPVACKVTAAERGTAESVDMIFGED